MGRTFACCLVSTLEQTDVKETLHQLSDKGISVISLVLGAVDLTSPAGKLQVQMMAAVSEFERNRIREQNQGRR